MEHFANQLKNNWLFIALFVSMIVWYSTVNTRLATAEQAIVDLKQISAKQEETRSEIFIRLERIDTNIEFIKDKVR